MRNNSLLKKGLLAVTTAAFAAVLGFGFDVNAAPNRININSVSVDARNQVLNVGRGDNNEISVGFGKLKNGRNGQVSGQLLTIADNDFDVYTDENVRVDLSHLKTNKENYILIKGDRQSDPIAIELGASEQKLKVKSVKYNQDSKKGEIDAPVITATTGSATGVDIATMGVEYRTEGSSYGEDSTYTSETPATLMSYLNRGTTLYFRVGASDGNLDAKLVDSKPLVVYANKNDIGETDKQIPVYGNGISLAGKEVKTKLAARAKGPSLKVDYVKNQIALTDKNQYRILTEDGVVGDGFVPGIVKKDATSIKIGTTDYMFAGASDLYLESRVAGKSDEKKPSSKITSIKLPAIQNFTYKGGATCNVTSTSIIVSPGSITADYDNNKKNLVFTNDSTAVFQYTTTDATATSVGTDATWKDITAKKKSTDVAKATKLTLNGNDGKLVWVRKKGDKNAKTWTTGAVALGKIGSGAIATDSDVKTGGGGTDVVPEAAPVFVVNVDGPDDGMLTIAKGTNNVAHTGTIEITGVTKDGSEVSLEDVQSFSWTAEGDGISVNPDEDNAAIGVVQAANRGDSGKVKVTVTFKNGDVAKGEWNVSRASS